jgi:hypothetical protein
MTYVEISATGRSGSPGTVGPTAYRSPLSTTAEGVRR